MDMIDNIIEVNGKKYIRQNPVSGLFRPITIEPMAKPIDIIQPVKPIFVCNRQCSICSDKKFYIV
jgi:hypothetical protein